MGLVGPIPRTWIETLDVLWSKTVIDDTSGCFLWQGHTYSNGYGAIGWQGKQVLIHRLVYEKLIGGRPPVVMHKCDIPNCWNYRHLTGGTQYDNIQDMIAKGRHGQMPTPHGESAYCAKLSKIQVLEIRNSSLTVGQLARKYGVSYGAVYKIVNGLSWKHLWNGKE